MCANMFRAWQLHVKLPDTAPECDSRQFTVSYVLLRILGVNKSKDWQKT